MTLKLKEINQDDRGYINILEGDELGCEEVNISFTKKGYARGGCVHNKNDEYLLVISGEINLICGEALYQLDDGCIVNITKKTPHYYVATKTSLVMEWGATKEEKKEKFKEFREIVDRINDNRHL